MTDMLDGLLREAGALAPLYGEITMTRTINGGVIVTCAPTVGLINPGVLFHARQNLIIIDDVIEIAHQVRYRITGWDRMERALIVLLEEDMR